jgi:phytoene/squalene synthetase
MPVPRAFWLRRPYLLVRNLLANREKPDLQALEAIEDPDAFIWAILPHAARTFSACIALLPASSAVAAAVAYLYSRMLDTYEDLIVDRDLCDDALHAFASRFDAEQRGFLPPAPAITDAADRDDRDRAHLLLVRRAVLVDLVYLRLPHDTRAVIRDLVRDMSIGMRWSRETLASSGGVLAGEERLMRYCRHVLGNPVVFSVRLMRLAHGAPPQLTEDEREHAMRVGEMVQLANITRDLEKDLQRGVAYDTGLREYLGRRVTGADHALVERCRIVREKLLRLALARAPSYARIIETLPLPRWSIARASAVLMLLFTERYFRDCARRVGLEPWDGPSSILALFARTIPATFSPARARAEIARVQSAFLAAADQIAPAPATAGSVAVSYARMPT